MAFLSNRSKPCDERGPSVDVPRDFRLHGAGARRFRIARERFIDLPGRFGSIAVPDGERSQIQQGIDERPAAR
jgi:hypothetical protein